MTSLKENTYNKLVSLYPLPTKGIKGQWSSIFRNLKSYSFFVKQLVRVSLLTEYKRSFLGITWLLLVPIISIVTWIILNNAGIIEPGSTEIPYPAYVLLSTAIWSFFMEIYRSTSQIFLQRGRMMVMAKFPRETLVAEKLIIHLLKFIIPFSLNLIVLLLFGIKFKTIALLFPLSLLPILLLGLGIGLIVALFRVVAVDLANFCDYGMNFLMFLTPIIYAPKIELGLLSEIIPYNPLTYLIGFSRDLLTKGGFYEPLTWTLCSLLCLLFFLLAVSIFMKSEGKIVQRLIAN